MSCFLLHLRENNKIFHSRVRRSSDYGTAVVRRLAVRQARVRVQVFRDEDMERNLGEWRRMTVIYECEGMNVCTRKKYQK
jgi:hypothetical protein